MSSIPVSRLARLGLTVVSALAFVLALPGVSHAQRFTGELSGTVNDETGAVLPGASVVMTNEASGSQRSTVTNADGFFNFSAVPAATYTVTVSLQGFKSYAVKGIVLGAGDARSLRTISLALSQLQEVVSVEAEVQLTPLDSGEKSTTLAADQIENIPIVGTSAAELLRILPGMTPVTNGSSNRPSFNGEVIGINGNGEYQGGGGGANQSAIGNFSANGTRTYTLDITLDGAPGADPGCNCATSVNPNSEMTQEFKVLQSNFGADQAKGPNSMVVVSKSGGRDFHGSAFGYFRDYRLNSNEWFANKLGQDRVKNKFIYPGFTLGGPLLIPGTSLNSNRDKVFFFVGYEYYKQKIDTGYIRSWVPTQAMRNGDFSDAPNLGLSGGYTNKIPNVNGVPTPVIPSELIDPGGRVLLNAFPLPNIDANQTGGWNYVNNLLVDQPNHQFFARLDFNVSDNTKVFVRYNLQRETQPWVIGLWWRNGQRQVPYPAEIQAPNRSDSISSSLTHVFNPTLTSETIFAFTYIDFQNKFTDRAPISRSGLGYPYQGIYGESQDTIPSVDAGGWGDNGPMYTNPGGFDPVLYATKWQYAITQNLTKVAGTHTLKAGAFWEYVKNEQPGNGYSNEFIEQDNWFSGNSGNSFADLLMGNVGSIQAQTKNILHSMDYNRVEGYINDSWRMKPNLTLTGGVRVSYMGAWGDSGNNAGLAGWDQSTYDPATPRSDFPGVVWNARNSSYPLSLVDGYLAWQPRAGFAWDIKGTGETVLRGGAGIYIYHDPQQPYDTLYELPAGVRSVTLSGTSLAAVEGAGGGDLVFGGAALNVKDKGQPKTYNWSLTVNQRLPLGMNIELGYVGNKSVNQMNRGIANINALPLGAALYAPTGYDPNAYRTMSQYAALNVYQHSAFQNYHGLQAMLARQRGSLNYTLAYTFSKALGIRGDTQGPNFGSEYVLVPYRDYNYGVLTYDRTHVASLSFSWMIPGAKQGVAGVLLDGWQIAGIGQYVSGAPLASVRGNFGLTGTMADGRNIETRWFTGSDDVAVMPLLSCDPRENVPDGYLFNPSCFTLPAMSDGTNVSNGNYVLPYLKGQAFMNMDLSIFKNFNIGGDRKLQLRASAYNVLNHPIATPDDGTNLTLRFENGVLSDPAFGRLPSKDDPELGPANKYGRRIVQLALRLTF